MQKHKKHQFSHKDPEIVVHQELTDKNNKKKVETSAGNVPSFVYRDLKRTGYIIGIFLALLATVYFIQTKTDWLSPVLKIFGL